MATSTKEPKQNPDDLIDAEKSLVDRGIYDTSRSANSSNTSSDLSEELSKKEKGTGSASNTATNPNFYHSAGKAHKSSKSSSTTNTVGSTLGGGNFSAGKIYTKLLGTNKKKFGAGGLIACLAAIFIMMFTFLLPLKVVSVMNNLQNKFFSTSQDAMDKEVDRLFSNYIKGKYRYAAAATTNCRSKIIDRSCNPYTAADGYIKKLYRSWNDSNLEEKLLKQYGVAFAIRDRNSANGPYYVMEFFDKNGNNVGFTGLKDMLAPDSTLTIDDMLNNNSSWSQVTRNQFRNSYKKALEHETWYTRTMYRIKVGKLLERKYGVKRCIILCKYRDDFADWGDSKKRAAVLYTTERVMGGRFEMYGLLYACVLNENCNPDDYSKSTTETVTADENGCQQTCITNGQARTKIDNDIRTGLLPRLAANYNGDVDAMKQDYDLYRDKGFIGYLLAHYRNNTAENPTAFSGLVGGLAESQALQQAQNFIPIVGWINRAATFVKTVNILPVVVPKMAYVMNSTSTASYYTMYRTVTDEQKNGHIDAAILGSFASGLGGGIQPGSTEGNQLGGTAEAENSPLYKDLISGGGTNTDTRFASASSWFAPKTYAASSDLRCGRDNQPFPADNTTNGKTCGREEMVNQPPGVIIQQMAALKSNPLWSTISLGSDAWISLKSSIIGQAKSAFCTVTVIVCDAFEEAGKKAFGLLGSLIPESVKTGLESALEWFMETILEVNSDLISSNMSGARAFDMLVAGADVSGNSFAQNGLGGAQLSSAQVAEIAYQQQMKRYDDYQSQPFLARVFDKDSEFSPMTKIALSMPSSKTTAAHSLASTIFNIPSLMKSMFASIFNYNQAGAASVATMDDPFGVIQYGYPADDPTLESDPEKFWSENCVSKGSMTDDSSTDPNMWSLTKLYNKYGEITANANMDAAYNPVNNEPGKDLDPLVLSANQKYIDAFKKKSPRGTNRCLLIQAAVGSSGAVFTDEVLSPEERSSGGSTTGGTPTTPTGGSVDLTGADQSSTQCDPRTKDVGVYQGYQGGNPVQIRLCSLPNLPCSNEECNGGYGIRGADGHALVNAAASAAFYNMVEAANAALPANLKLSANSTFRTYAHQQSLCPCDGITVARPGFSNHQMGLAIDFDIKGISESRTYCIDVAGVCTASGHQDWEWLAANSKRFGLSQYVNEFWHFSPSGH